MLRDYSEDMVLPALELYTHGLMADSTMYDAFLARQHEQGIPFTHADGAPRSPETDTDRP